MAKTPVKIARIYLRVSTEEQDLARQAEVEKSARSAGYYVAGVYREKASGARVDRPELQRMIGDLQSGEVVVAEKIDLFVGSATEDPGRKPAVRAGFRGGRYVSAEASLRGEWKPGGSSKPGMDAYATSKQCNIVTALALARENPRLHVNAIEPGLMLSTGLHGHMSTSRKFLLSTLSSLLAPFVKVLSTPKRAARILEKILTDTSGATGVYYDEGGHPMAGSAFVQDINMQDRVVTETRALLSRI